MIDEQHLDAMAFQQCLADSDPTKERKPKDYPVDAKNYFLVRMGIIDLKGKVLCTSGKR